MGICSNVQYDLGNGLLIFLVFSIVLVAWRCYKHPHNNKEKGNCMYDTQRENQQDMCDLQDVSGIKIDALFQATYNKNSKWA